MIIKKINPLPEENILQNKIATPKIKLAKEPLPLVIPEIKKEMKAVIISTEPSAINPPDETDKENKYTKYILIAAALSLILFSLAYYVFFILNADNKETTAENNTVKLKELELKEKQLNTQKQNVNKPTENNSNDINYGILEGTYSVGNVTCNITSNDKVYWNKGYGYTNLTFISEKDELILFTEHQTNGAYSGSFTFYRSFASGKYERADGVIFNVSKIK